MTNEEYIRRGVELATGWELESHAVRRNGTRIHYQIQRLLPEKDLPQYILDALAAQLTRQVDALPVGEFPDDAPTTLYILNGSSDLWHKKRLAVQAEGPDRTTNTIKAIVDSGVLE